MNIQYINEVFHVKDSTSKMMIPTKFFVDNKYIFQIQKILIESNSCLIASSVDLKTNQNVAIKCIPIKYFQDASKEALIMKGINHPNIIKIIDSTLYPTQNPRFFAIFMPLAICDLSDYINSYGPLSEADTCKVMKKILNAVQFLHQNNIWHRDLKSENILILKDGKIVIADLGLSDYFNTKTYQGRCVGTIQYAAPELLEINLGKLEFKTIGCYNDKIDTWSMGIIMYEILCGATPYDPSNEEDVSNFIMGEVVFDLPSDVEGEYEEIDGEIYVNPLVFFKNVSENAKNLIRMMLCHDPNKRPTIDELLQHSWFNSFT